MLLDYKINLFIKLIFLLADIKNVNHKLEMDQIWLLPSLQIAFCLCEPSLSTMTGGAGI